MIFSNSCKRAALLCSALFLSTLLTTACVSNQEYKQSQDPAYTRMADGQGAAIVKVVTHTAVTPASVGTTVLEIRSLADGKTYKLTNKSATSHNVSLFFESLPPGRYQAVELSTFYGDTSRRSPLEKFIGPLEVEAGRVSDWGTLVMVFESVGLGDGKYRIAHTASPVDAKAILDSLPQDALDKMLDRPILQAPITIYSDNSSQLEIARRYSAITAQSVVKAGEPVAFGHTLGQVRIWDPLTSQWDLINTGSGFPVSSILREPSGAYLIGLQQGLLLEWRKGVLATLPSPEPGTTISLLSLRDNGEYIAVLEARDHISIMTTKNPRVEKWRELKRLPYERELGLRAAPKVRVGMVGDRVVVMTVDQGKWGDNAKVSTLDLASSSFFENPFRASFNPMLDKGAETFRILPSGVILSTEGGGFSRNLLFSSDWGKTWMKEPMEKWSKGPVSLDGKTVYCYRPDDAGLTTFGENAPASLWRSENSGASWERLGPVPLFTTRMYLMPKAGYLMSATWNGGSFLSSDNGRSWRQHY